MKIIDQFLSESNYALRAHQIGQAKPMIQFDFDGYFLVFLIFCLERSKIPEDKTEEFRQRFEEISFQKNVVEERKETFSSFLIFLFYVGCFMMLARVEFDMKKTRSLFVPKDLISFKIDFKQAKALITYKFKIDRDSENRRQMREGSLFFPKLDRPLTQEVDLRHLKITSKVNYACKLFGRGKARSYYRHYKIEAFDDSGEEIWVKAPSAGQLMTIVEDDDWAKRFEYLDFVVEHSERFEPENELTSEK